MTTPSTTPTLRFGALRPVISVALILGWFASPAQAGGHTLDPHLQPTNSQRGRQRVVAEGAPGMVEGLGTPLWQRDRLVWGDRLVRSDADPSIR